MTNDRAGPAPPSKLLLALEARVFASPVRLIAAAPLLMSAPRGEPQPVMVLPGLYATDRSTAALRYYLRFLGYQAHGWSLGRNDRPAGADLPAVAARIAALRAATGTRVTLVGWSRGGLIAREATRMVPDAVRMVITLGSPFAGSLGDERRRRLEAPRHRVGAVERARRAAAGPLHLHLQPW